MRWTVADVLDFEHLLAASEADDAAALAQDRERLRAQGPRLAQAPADLTARRAVLRAWLDLRRQRADTTGASALPGALWDRGERAARTLSIGLGAAAGIALAGAWLGGSGTEPVNAPLLWITVVGLQLAFVLAAALGWAARSALGRAASRSALGGLALGLIERLGRMGQKLSRQRGGEARDALRATLGRLASRRDVYGGLMVAPALSLTQRFAVAFNAGLLFAMLALHLPLVDLRFGWQSSYPVSPQQLHAVVDVVATPWRFVWPQAQPSLAEVASTRYARGQLADSLATGAARAWWPFLAMSIACYGLLLRALLLAALGWSQRRRLALLRFDQPEARLLFRALIGPPIAAQAGMPGLDVGTGITRSVQPATGPALALVDREWQPATGSAAEQLATRLGLTPDDVVPAAIDDRQASAPVLARLAEHRPPLATLWVVAPASRDPIVAVARFLRELLAAAQANEPRAEVGVLLLEADEARLAIWRRFAQIQRLPVTVEALA